METGEIRIRTNLSLLMKSWILLFSLINAATIFAQTSNHEKVVPSRGFISKIEIFGGVTWMYPKTYFEPEESERQFKLGNVIGGALTHSFSNRFDQRVCMCNPKAICKH